MDPTLARIDLNKLNTFFAVAEHGGVSAAAAQLALTPSAVSQALAGLEASLALRLFNRIGRRLVLTREGELLRAGFRDYQERLGATLREVMNEEREARGRVRVGLFLGFPRPRLVRFLEAFTRRHPAVTVQLGYGSRQELRKRLLANRLDFAFSFDPEGERRSKIEATRLFSHELVLAAGRRLYSEPFDLETLRRTPVIDYYASDPLIERWARHHFRRKPGPLPVRIWAATTDLVLDLVLSQAGVGVLPRDLLEPHLARGRLRVVGTGRREMRDHLWLEEQQGTWRNAALDAFHDAATSELRDA